MQPTFCHRLDVRFRDCDGMGHVNNAVYLTYLEQTRLLHWRERLAVDPRRSGEGIILARAEVDFRSPATFGDTLDVGLVVAKVGQSSFSYDYEIVEAADGRLVAAARTVQVWFDYATGKSVPIPEQVRLKLEEEALARRNRE